VGLVLLDQPAGVLDRGAGDRRGVHRVAQHLAHVAAGAAGQEVLGVHEVRHRLEERPEHLAALVADVAHHLQLLVDDHEELVDLLLVGEEGEQVALEVGRGRAVGRGHLLGQPEGAGDGVHPHLAPVHADVPLGAGADEVAVAGEEAEGPVGTVLALEQPAEDGQGLLGAPVRDDRAVAAADDEVGALTLADLVGDDLLDDLGVVVVVDVEAAAVGQGDLAVGDGVEDLGDGVLPLLLDVDHHQRGAVVVRLEATLGDLAERHRDEPVARAAGRGRTRLQRHVHDRLRHPAPTADQSDGVLAAHAGGAPDQGPRLVPLQRVDRGTGIGAGRRHG
jgi:hypothetical protein